MGRVAHYALILVAWLSISSASVIVLLSRSSALVCAFWRLMIATLLISLYSAVTRGFGGLRDLEAVSLSAIAGVFLAIHFLTWMESLFYIPISLSTTIVVLYPLMAMLYEAALKVSRPKLSEVAGILVAFCGTIVAVQPYLAGGALYGSVLAFIGAAAGGAYFAMGRYLRKGGMGLSDYTLVCYGSSTALILVYGLATRRSLLPPEPESWVYLALLALIPMIGGHTVINYLVKYMKSYVATVIGFGEAPGATILASLFLSQEVELNVLLGMAIALSGAIFTVREGVKR